jgi:4-diphosphocytidyl-2-C-methyl-D-erythritol kinase
LLFKSFEAVVGEKFPAIPVVFEQLQARHGLAPRMSGSGSACFAMLPDGADVGAIRHTIADAWGEAAWVVETVIEG